MRQKPLMPKWRMRSQGLPFLPAKARALDWGYGFGGNAKAFAGMDYSVVAVDVSGVTCDALRQNTGVEVRCEDFLDLMEKERRDGIWACESLLYLKRRQLLDALVLRSESVGARRSSLRRF